MLLHVTFHQKYIAEAILVNNPLEVLREKIV